MLGTFESKSKGEQISGGQLGSFYLIQTPKGCIDSNGERKETKKVFLVKTFSQDDDSSLQLEPFSGVNYANARKSLGRFLPLSSSEFPLKGKKGWLVGGKRLKLNWGRTEGEEEQLLH